MDEVKKASKNKWLKVALGIILVLSLATSGVLLWQYFHPASDGGATITTISNKTTEEIQADLDQQVKDSMMTISVSTKCKIEDGRVRVNVINAEKNKFDQSFELIQNDKVLYKSGLISPGQTVEWCDAKDAVEGDATITVYAHKTGEANTTGNPQSAAVSLVVN